MTITVGSMGVRSNRGIELSPAALKLSIIEIGDLPIYNQDGDENPPALWTQFHERIRAVDAVLFVTPEHNRSVPAALKNAIDIGSRPYGKSAWSGKPGAVVSASPSGIGGFGANHHLRQSLVFPNIPAMAQPEAYIGGADKLFDANGKLSNDGTCKFFARIHAVLCLLDRCEQQIITETKHPYRQQESTPDGRPRITRAKSSMITGASSGMGELGPRL